MGDFWYLVKLGKKKKKFFPISWIIFSLQNHMFVMCARLPHISVRVLSSDPNIILDALCNMVTHKPSAS